MRLHWFNFPIQVWNTSVVDEVYYPAITSYLSLHFQWTTLYPLHFCITLLQYNCKYLRPSIYDFHSLVHIIYLFSLVQWMIWAIVKYHPLHVLTFNCPYSHHLAYFYCLSVCYDYISFNIVPVDAKSSISLFINFFLLLVHDFSR